MDACRDRQDSIFCLCSISRHFGRSCDVICQGTMTFLARHRTVRDLALHRARAPPTTRRRSTHGILFSASIKKAGTHGSGSILSVHTVPFDLIVLIGRIGFRGSADE
jgi:hypothetical protein